MRKGRFRLFFFSLMVTLMLPKNAHSSESNSEKAGKTKDVAPVEACYHALSPQALKAQEASLQALKRLKPTKKSLVWLNDLEVDLRQLYSWSGFTGPSHLILSQESLVVHELSGTESQKLLYDDHGARTQQVRNRLRLLQALRASQLRVRIDSWTHAVEGSKLSDDKRTNLADALDRISDALVPFESQYYRGSGNSRGVGSFNGQPPRTYRPIHSPSYSSSLVNSPGPILKTHIQSAMSVLESIRDPESTSGHTRFQVVPPVFSLLPDPKLQHEADSIKRKRVESLRYILNQGYRFTQYHQGFDSVVVTGQIKSTGFPEIDEQIERLNSIGGQVGLLSVVKGRTGELEKRRLDSPPIGAFFSLDSGVPVAGVDFLADYSGQSLAHEISHADDFHRHYNDFLAQGYSQEEAFQLAKIKQLSPTEQRDGETRALMAEKEFRERFPDSVFNKGAYAQAVNYWDMGYIQGQNYPEMVGIRVILELLHKAASGQPMDAVERAHFKSKTPIQWLNQAKNWTDIILKRSQETREKAFQYWVAEYENLFEQMDNVTFHYQKRPFKQKLQAIDDYLFYLAENNLFDLFISPFDYGNMADQFVLQYFAPLFWQRVVALEESGLSFTQELVSLKPIPEEKWTPPSFPGEKTSSPAEEAKTSNPQQHKQPNTTDDPPPPPPTKDEAESAEQEPDDSSAKEQGQLFPWFSKLISGAGGQ